MNINISTVAEKHSHLVDINHLRGLGIEPRFFGLGFVQLKLNKTDRVHFWHPRISSVVNEEELHDHRYNFASTILVGEITHEVWDYTPDAEGQYVLTQVSCDPKKPAPDIPNRAVRVEKTHEYNFKAGSSYTVNHTDFHRIRANYAMTFVRREEVVKDLATVLRPVGFDPLCPFNHSSVTQVNTDDCWEIIDEVLNGIPHGYHRMEIPRGVFGESSKILEEALELVDADRQNNSVMALCELSDMVGAIKEYLARNHKSVSLEDLQTMAEATGRAFRDGTR